MSDNDASAKEILAVTMAVLVAVLLIPIALALHAIGAY